MDLDTASSIHTADLEAAAETLADCTRRVNNAGGAQDHLLRTSVCRHVPALLPADYCCDRRWHI